MSIKRLEAMTLSGRYFTKKDFKLIKEISCSFPNLSRTELSKTIAENLFWYQSNKEPKWIACIKVLEKLDTWGHIKLPALQAASARGSRKTILTEKTNSESLIIGQIDEYEPIKIEPVSGRENTGLWNEYIERYHYLGHKIAFGCQQKYFIKFFSGKLLGCLSFSASAWSVQCRDEWIGWDRKQRSKSLYLVVANSRFLIFPWVKIKNLASKILSLSVKQVPDDWEKRYNYRPMLLESFVDKGKFKGTCYRAANWQYLGDTKGRGRMDRYKKNILCPKEVFVYPLRNGN